MTLEKMDEFFDRRADTYDDHMLVELQLAEFYQEIADCFPAGHGIRSLLDLGCGTGLELELLYKKIPDLKVTGIDMAQGMLNVLKTKYDAKAPKLICGSYFETDLGVNRYDFALSTYSLHHFSKEEKTGLYRKIYASLRPGGLFVLGDYTCKTRAEQLFYQEENERLRTENGISGGFWHYDTPFTAEAEIGLLKAAGFPAVELRREWESTSIIAAGK